MNGLLVYSGLAYLVLALWQSFRNFRKETSTPDWEWRLSIWLCLAYLGLVCVRIGMFDASYSLLDNVEPGVISTAWNWNRGGPLYHNLDSPERYSLLYGPYYYLVVWAFLRLLGPSLLAAKLSGAFLLGASVILLGQTLRRSVSRATVILCITYAVLALVLRSPVNTSYGVRAEPHLIFWTAVGLYASGLSIRALAGCLCGLATGLLITIKLHGALYASPFLALLYQKHGSRVVAGSLSVAVAQALAPFVLLPEISLPNYLAWLGLAFKHGLSSSWKSTCRFEAILLSPIAAGLISLALMDVRAFRAFVVQNRALLAATALSLLLVVVPASKTGSGPWHVFPLILPLALVLGLLISRLCECRQVGSVWSRLLAPAVGLGYALRILVLAVPGHVSALSMERKADTACRAMAAELTEIERRLPPGKTLSVGYGSNDELALMLSIATISALHGNTFLIDPTALQDMKQGGIGIPLPLLADLRQGRVYAWVLPAHQEPFTLWSEYERDCQPRPMLFDPEFRKLFLENYAVTETTPHFEVWTYQGSVPLGTNSAGDVP